MIYFFQTQSVKVRFLGLVVLGFFVLAFQWLVGGAPWALAQLKVLSAGAGVPDSLFWYDPATLQALFAAWGEPGRRLYLTILWPSDTGFLVAYGAFLTGAVLYLLKKANPKHPWWYFLPLVPLGGAGADFLENATVALASVLPASGWEPVSWVASGWTALKWLGLALTVAILVVGVVVHLVRRSWKAFQASGPVVLEETQPEEPSKN